MMGERSGSQGRFFYRFDLEERVPAEHCGVGEQAVMKLVDKQATSRSSKFLDACRAYNRGELSEDALVDTTARLGFGNVIDAFHGRRRASARTRMGTSDSSVGPLRDRGSRHHLRVANRFAARSISERIKRRSSGSRHHHPYR